MKQQFRILKEHPCLSFLMTRDSVCAGDDCDAPHETIVELPSFLDPTAFAHHATLNYLPTVSGVNHCWLCKLNGTRIAELKHDGIRALVRENSFEEDNTIHWQYISATG